MDGKNCVKPNTEDNVKPEETRPSILPRRRFVDWTDWITAIAMHPITLIAVGSAVGGNLRYWIGRWIDSRQLPWELP
jgi:hypothetical protein